MSDIKVRTNHNRRDVIYGHELTEKERKEFDYYAWPNPDEWDGNSTIKDESGKWVTIGWDIQFVRYRDVVYSLSDFGEGRPPEDWQNGPWDAYQSDSFYSGVVVYFPIMCDHWPEHAHGQECDGTEIDTDHVIMGTYYAH